MSMAQSKAKFGGFPAGALAFLKGIQKNNNRDWFEKNKANYEQYVRDGMYGLVEAVDQDLLDYAPEYITDPKKAVYRIYRDVRFAKDKTPYKTNVAASWYRQNLGKNETAGFYVQLDTKELFIGGGIYMPQAATLKTLRAYIADRHEPLREILAAKPLKTLLGTLQGEPAKRTPKGYLPGHPAEDLLRHKMYIVWTTLPPEVAYTPKLVTEVSKRFRAMAPFIEYLNGALRAKPPQLFF